MTGAACETDGVDALFVPDGPRLIPTDRARGPWSPDVLHGGPVGAVVRPGRKVQVVDTVVERDGAEVAWGRAPQSLYIEPGR
jgi:hypothetical protein